MSKFFSFGHSNYGGEGQAQGQAVNPAKASQSETLEQMKQHPQFKQYYDAHKDFAGKATGLTEGEKITWKGEPAEVMHEEYNQHDHTVETTIRVSDRNSSGTKKVKWNSESDKKMVIQEGKRSFS